MNARQVSTPRPTLPPHQPGVVTTIDLEQLPAYLSTHQLIPLGKGEVRDLLERTGQPRRQVLYVKRAEDE